MNFSRAWFLLAAFLALGPVSAAAQDAGKMLHLGVLVANSEAAARADYTALRTALAVLGYAEGRNLVIDYLHADGDLKRLPDLAAELVRTKPDVIVAASNPAIGALHKATTTIPIVMAVVGDPIGAGFVASLARPGGNITGLTNIAPQLSGKRVELLKEVVPGLKRVGVVRNPAIPTYRTMWDETSTAATSFGLQTIPVDISTTAEIGPAFVKLTQAGAQAIVLLSDTFTAQYAKDIVELAAANKLPAMYPLLQFMDAGGLMLYGPDARAMWARSAYFVDRIFKGTNPADLPVEQPAKFELIVNSTAAKQLGITFPKSVLLRADRVMP